ncbi:hypothetical protein FA95DRAFT_545473 [Auriscalpium vulgare]|uniref:Uncharacterized protein n=1 Tax=Auriscalpium vulgare TaxID=40419 RepID=A0ACB8REV4_9AGAM|nr:hypothetical protein FA95DRAFT_545473 [Auriscalpium vulgare]
MRRWTGGGGDRSRTEETSLGPTSRPASGIRLRAIAKVTSDSSHSGPSHLPIPLPCPTFAFPLVDRPRSTVFSPSPASTYSLINPTTLLTWHNALSIDICPSSLLKDAAGSFRTKEWTTGFREESACWS